MNDPLSAANIIEQAQQALVRMETGQIAATLRQSQNLGGIVTQAERTHIAIPNQDGRGLSEWTLAGIQQATLPQSNTPAATLNNESMQEASLAGLQLWASPPGLGGIAFLIKWIKKWHWPTTPLKNTQRKIKGVGETGAEGGKIVHDTPPGDPGDKDDAQPPTAAKMLGFAIKFGFELDSTIPLGKDCQLDYVDYIDRKVTIRSYDKDGAQIGDTKTPGEAQLSRSIDDKKSTHKPFYGVVYRDGSRVEKYDDPGLDVNKVKTLVQGNQESGCDHVRIQIDSTDEAISLLVCPDDVYVLADVTVSSSAWIEYDCATGLVRRDSKGVSQGDQAFTDSDSKGPDNFSSDWKTKLQTDLSGADGTKGKTVHWGPPSK